MKQKFEEEFRAVQAVLVTLQSTYIYFIDKKSKKNKKKDLELLLEMSNKIVENKDMMSNMKVEIVPHIQDYGRLTGLVEQLRNLQDGLKEHLQILENMRRNKDEFELNRKYELSQIETIRLFGMVQLQIIIAAKHSWTNLLEKFNEIEQKYKEEVEVEKSSDESSSVTSDNSPRAPEIIIDPITSVGLLSESIENCTVAIPYGWNPSEVKKDESPEESKFSFTQSAYETKDIPTIDPGEMISAIISPKNWINTFAQSFWEQYNKTDQPMPLDEFNKSLNEYLNNQQKGPKHYPFWRYCDLVNKQHNLTVRLEEASEVFNTIPEFRDNLLNESETIDKSLLMVHNYLNNGLQDKPLEKSLELNIYNADGKTKIARHIITNSSLPFSVGTNILGNSTLTDPDIAIKQLEIISMNDPNSYFITCHSTQNLTLFEIPSYPCKVKLIPDLSIFLGRSNKYYRVQECVNRSKYSGGNMDMLGMNMDYLDPWMHVREQEERELEHGVFEGVKTTTLGNPFLLLVNQEANEEHSLRPHQGQNIFTMGRGLDQYINVIDNYFEKSISQRHCIIGYDHQFGWYIGENQVPSTNGTYLALLTSHKRDNKSPSFPFLLSNTMNFFAGNHVFIVCYTIIYSFRLRKFMTNKVILERDIKKYAAVKFLHIYINYIDISINKL